MRDGVRGACRRAVRFLTSCQVSSGAILEPADPLAVLTNGGSAEKWFFAAGGADAWHTANALIALGPTNRIAPRARAFLARCILSDGTLSHSSASRGTCIETTAAAALVLPARRAALRRAIRRHAQPDGRWATFITSTETGHDTYVTGPSVIGWALDALGAGARRGNQGAATLREDLGRAPIWSSHPAFYATPFYPAHLAARLVPAPSVERFTVETQHRSGGWGFGDASGRPAAIPTALAVLTLGWFGPSEAGQRAIERARQWLVAHQSPEGSWQVGPAPKELWYAGSVYSTSLALRALSDRSP